MKTIICSGYIGETKRNAKVRWNEHMIQLKVQNHRITFETMSTTVLPRLLFQMLKKTLRSGRTKRHHILLSGNLILIKKRTFKHSFYLEMVLHRAINDIMQTP